MVSVFLLLIGCTILAYAYKADLVEVPNTDSNSIFLKKYNSTFAAKIFFAVLLVTLIIFAGTRNEMNDTLVYGRNFDQLDYSSIFEIEDWSIGANPFFVAYQIIIKKYITQNTHGFFLITSCIVVTSYILFFRKHSFDFGFSIYTFIAFTVYAFTMAAMKQTLAIAIAIWAVPLFLKKKSLTAIFLIIIAMLFHPYVFLYVVMLFLTENIWDKRSVIIIITTILAGVFFTRFIGGATEFVTIIGDEYSDDLLEGSVNIFRVLVYLVTPILSFVFRESLREKNNKLINLLVNLSLVAACFMVIGLFGAANLMGRLANYFDIFVCISLPVVIEIGLENKANKKAIVVLAFVFFAVFYYVHYARYADVAENRLFSDFYNHRSLFDILGAW